MNSMQFYYRVLALHRFHLFQALVLDKEYI